MKFEKRPIIVEATRWFKNGDHPNDDCFRPFEDTGLIPEEPREGLVVRRYRRPDIDGYYICQECGKTMHEHGWIDTCQGGHTVCPGDWIINETTRPGFYPCKPDAFNETYETIE